MIRSKINQFSKEILEKKPMLIIDAKRRGLLNLDYSNSDEVDSSQKRNLQEFMSTFKTNYIFKEQRFGVDFYILKE